MEKPSVFAERAGVSLSVEPDPRQTQEGTEGKRRGKEVGAEGAEAALEEMSAGERLQWAFGRFGGRIALSSSFGIQAGVLLHLVARLRPDIPVIFVDTGYLFPETYRYADLLAGELGLRLYVAQAPLSAAWFEARHGRLWEQGVEGLDRYNELRKVEPMRRALADLGVECWLAGLRRAQARTRAELPVLQWEGERGKLHPIVDWSDEQVEAYFREWKIPRHPLSAQGYVSVGDMPTSRPWEEGMLPEETRFFGWKRECGLHSPRPAPPTSE